MKCDLSTKEITIRYHDGKTGPETLKRPIEKPGYTATDITEKGKKEPAA